MPPVIFCTLVEASPSAKRTHQNLGHSVSKIIRVFPNIAIPTFRILFLPHQYPHFDNRHCEAGSLTCIIIQPVAGLDSGFGFQQSQLSSYMRSGSPSGHSFHVIYVALELGILTLELILF